MDFVWLIVSAMMVLICFYLIVSPFFKAEGTMAHGGERKAEAEEALTLDTIYKAANELEMDFLMKKMAEPDYLQLKEQYQLLANDLIRQERKVTGKTGKTDMQNQEIELEILAELQKMRKQKGR
ncbi:MAG: hypothetical protein WB502_08840 [Thermoactinomyces sp.]